MTRKIVAILGVAGSGVLVEVGVLRATKDALVALGVSPNLEVIDNEVWHFIKKGVSHP